MAFLRRNVWLLFYVLVALSLVLMLVLGERRWQELQQTHLLRQQALLEQWSGSLTTLLVQQETIMDVLGDKVVRWRDTGAIQAEFERLVKINQTLFTGFALVRPDGNVFATASGLHLKNGKTINLLDSDNSRDSFLDSLTQDHLVPGRAYRYVSGQVIIPMRKALRNEQGDVVAVMSGAVGQSNLKTIFACNSALVECGGVRLLRAQDHFPLYEQNISGREDYFNVPLGEGEYRSLMSALDNGRILGEGGVHSYRRQWGADDNSGVALYDPRYGLWLTLETPRKKLTAEMMAVIRGYLLVFFCVHICLYFLFRLIHNAEKKRREELMYQANHDVLTGLPNRNCLQQQFVCDCAANTPAALLFLDMNNFKAVNDSFGHACGDKVLKEIGRRIRAGCHKDEEIFRLGGDEFVVLYHGDETDIFARASQLVTDVTRLYSVDGRNFMLGGSVGVARCPQDGITLDQLLRAADIAMYEAKRHKKSVCVFEPHMADVYLRRISIEQELRTAVADGELSVVYQPQMDADGNFWGVECLIRWHNQRLGGAVGPDEFIPVAESAGLMPEIGQYVIATGLQHLSDIQKQCGHDFHISINISVRQFLHDDFLPALLADVARYDVQKLRIVLEITESIFIEDMDQIVSLIHRIHEQGIRISMDDFGTGYSSLSLLHRLPVDEIKIDRSFVTDIQDNARALRMVQSIIAIGKNHGMALLAEGVETAEQLRILRDCGCDRFQGYYFARPLVAESLQHFISQHAMTNYS